MSNATENSEASPQRERTLIVNADDFGQSEGINRGIIEAHERGIVTSASLMVRWPAARGAVAYARDRAQLSVGLHIDLGEWAFRSGEWVCLYEVVAPQNRHGVQGEVERQLACFLELMGRRPSHVDSHQHVHLQEPIRTIVRDLASRLSIPVRHHSPVIAYRGEFYGQSRDGASYGEGISVESLIRLLRSLQPGVTELGCHPAYADDLDSMYRAEREREIQTLCDARVRTALEALGIHLRSFDSLEPSLR